MTSRPPRKRLGMRQLASHLAARLARHAVCRQHPLDEASDDCPACQDRDAFLIYEDALHYRTPHDFLVCDERAGVLRREPTIAAALDWWRHDRDTSGALNRHKYGPGAYAYAATGGDEDDPVDSVMILRVDRARHYGYDPDQTPLYPYVAMPWERVERTSQAA